MQLYSQSLRERKEAACLNSLLLTQQVLKLMACTHAAAALPKASEVA